VKGYRNAVYNGFPTQVRARIIGDLLADQPTLGGLVQIASAPISKYALLTMLKEALALDVEIEPFEDEPCDRSLSAARFVAATGYHIPSWEEMVAELAADPTPYTDMTRFLLSLDQAVDTVFAALSEARRGGTYIPRVPSALVLDIAESLIGERPVKTEVTGIRPGEKVHEILVSEEESHRTVDRGRYYAILPMLLELRDGQAAGEALEREYSSADDVMARETLDQLLTDHRLTLSATADGDAELLR
jgi:hypothetical protein